MSRINILFALLIAFILPAQSQEAASAQPEQSLADVAKKLRANKKADVVVTEDDAQKLFHEMDSTLKFAAKSSGFPIRGAVKHKLIGRKEADKHFAEALADSEEAQEIQRSELVLKKLGLLPPAFKLKDFIAEAGAEDVAGFYDPRDKTMYLLNWIDLQKQMPVMAHELTHALQDQNFNIDSFRQRTRDSRKAAGASEGSSNEMEARTAVIEGQAMVVYLDYMIKPLGITVAETTENVDRFKSRLLSVYESPVSFHTAPLVFKELTMFPYFDGFVFELELLKHSGTHAAFTGAFQRPPRNTHEILQPQAYWSGAPTPSYKLPDLNPALGTQYKIYDSGSMGELDVRIMSKQFGRENDAFSVAPNWNGGAYLAVRKPSAADKAEDQLVADDLALIYVSRWKTYTAAQRFAEIYKSAVLKRSHVADPASAKAIECEAGDTTCKVKWSARFETEDGPVVMEIALSNTLMITQGLADTTVAQVKQAIARPARSTTQASNQLDLSLRLMSLPVVRAMRKQMLQAIVSGLTR